MRHKTKYLTSEELLRNERPCVTLGGLVQKSCGLSMLNRYQLQKSQFLDRLCFKQTVFLSTLFFNMTLKSQRLKSLKSKYF